jgi:hypothetical protein
MTLTQVRLYDFLNLASRRWQTRIDLAKYVGLRCRDCGPPNRAYPWWDFTQRPEPIILPVITYRVTWTSK